MYVVLQNSAVCISEGFCIFSSNVSVKYLCLYCDVHFSLDVRD